MGNRFDRLLLRPAFRDAYDKPIDSFRCFYSHAILELRDRYSIWYVSADHFVPGKKRYVITCRLFNDMKSALTGTEFLVAVPALDDHFRGIKQFDRGIIRFEAWNRSAPLLSLPRTVAPWELSRRAVTACTICGHPTFPGSIYCPVCRSFVYSRWEVAARAAALKRAWNEKLQAFLCYYTGLPLNVTDPKSPWYLVFDHLIPGQKGNLVACAFWVNAMKTFLTEKEFRAVIHSLTEHLRHGTPFDKSLIDEKRFRLAARRLGGKRPALRSF